MKPGPQAGHPQSSWIGAWWPRQRPLNRSRRQRTLGSGTSATPWRPSRVGSAQSNVSIPSCTPRDEVVDVTDPEQMAGRCGAWASSSAVVQATTSCIWALSWPSEPPIAIPSHRAAATACGGLAAQIGLHPPLDDPVDGLVGRAVLAHARSGSASSQRWVRSVERAV